MKTKEEIKELDPRQCVYSSYSTELDQLVIDGLTAIERHKNKINNSIKNITESENKIMSNYPNHDAYRWFNKRGSCVVFRTERNEKIFNWEEMLKLSL
jgi:hypothetical protein